MARAEAYRAGSKSILPAHMLIALSFSTGRLATFLQQQGVTAEAVRQRFPIGSRAEKPYHILFSTELTELISFAGS
jgi:hypothetical protein